MARVTMVLANGPHAPDGDLNDRLEMQVTLTAHSHLDAGAWEAGNTPWLVTWQRVAHPTATGELVKLEEGWALRSMDREDDPLSSLSASILRPGEIATVMRPNGDTLTYRIVSVEVD